MRIKNRFGLSMEMAFRNGKMEQLMLVSGMKVWCKGKESLFMQLGRFIKENLLMKNLLGWVSSQSQTEKYMKATGFQKNHMEKAYWHLKTGPNTPVILRTESNTVMEFTFGPMDQAIKASGRIISSTEKVSMSGQTVKNTWEILKITSSMEKV